MINHLLRFDDEGAARDALSAYWSGGDDGPRWNESICIPGQRWVIARATHDDKGNELTSEIVEPGFYITIILPQRCPRLRSLPDFACWLIWDGRTGQTLHRDLPLGPGIIEPMPAGAKGPIL